MSPKIMVKQVCFICHSDSVRHSETKFVCIHDKLICHLCVKDLTALMAGKAGDKKEIDRD